MLFTFQIMRLTSDYARDETNRSWRVDETYVRVAGMWTYLYRAVDSAGETIDFLLSPQRDLTAAKLFVRRVTLSGPGESGPE
jgi:transposase-like protein